MLTPLSTAMPALRLVLISVNNQAGMLRNVFDDVFLPHGLDVSCHVTGGATEQTFCSGECPPARSAASFARFASNALARAIN